MVHIQTHFPSPMRHYMTGLLFGYLDKEFDEQSKNSVFGGLSVKDYIEERAVEIANYIIDTKATVRQAAKKFGISKSTVHKDCTDRLSQLNPGLACEVRQVLDVNKQERHIRGGLATREKYLHQH